MRTNIFVIGVEAGVMESYGSRKRVNLDRLSAMRFNKPFLYSIVGCRSSARMSLVQHQNLSAATVF